MYCYCARIFFKCSAVCGTNLTDAQTGEVGATVATRNQETFKLCTVVDLREKCILSKGNL
jgi:hypothetical protein